MEQTTLKSFFIVKEIINNRKRQPIEWRKIFVNDMSNKGLLPKLHKELMELSIKRLNNPI